MPEEGRPPNVPDSRVVEYYDTVVELSAAFILREATGWLVLSAGQVSAERYWAEYERVPRSGD